MTQRIIDISPRISARIGVFPGDTPFAQAIALQRSHGHPVNLSSISTTVHLGAHADAPWHYDDAGRSMADVDLAPYWGPALVLHAPVARGERIGTGVLPRIQRYLRHFRPRPGERPAFRCLFATGTFPDPDRWNSDFASLSPELIQALAKRGCVLVGIDTPSVDPEDSKDLPSHAALRETGVRNLEGLYLDGVPEGWYTLVALPLNLEGLDGSPVRAALQPLRRPRGSSCR